MLSPQVKSLPVARKLGDTLVEGRSPLPDMTLPETDTAPTKEDAAPEDKIREVMDGIGGHGERLQIRQDPKFAEKVAEVVFTAPAEDVGEGILDPKKEALEGKLKQEEASRASDDAGNDGAPRAAPGVKTPDAPTGLESSLGLPDNKLAAANKGDKVLAGDSDSVRAGRGAEFKAPADRAVKAPLVQAGGGTTFGLKDEVKAGAGVDTPVHAPLVRAGGGTTFGLKDEVAPKPRPRSTDGAEAAGVPTESTVLAGSKSSPESKAPAVVISHPGQVPAKDAVPRKLGGDALESQLRDGLSLAQRHGAKLSGLPDGHKLLQQRQEALRQLGNRVTEAEVQNPAQQSGKVRIAP